MRNPERLYGFYSELSKVHIEHFPDWRFGQFINNFLCWIDTAKKRDPFFIEEDEMLDFLYEFAKEK